MKNFRFLTTAVKTLSVLTCLIFTQQLFSQCPTIQFVDLRGTPGFPQTDDLNVCGAPDTLSILMFTDAPGEVKGFEMTINMVSGMTYAGFQDTHFGGCTSISYLNTSAATPETPTFIANGVTCGDIFVANIGVTANCDVDLVNNDYLIEIEYSYTYFPPTGGSIKCKGTEVLDNDFNGAMKESVLNMFTPNPIDVTVTSLGSPACQTMYISQDGLQAYLDEFEFAVCGIDLGASSPISVSSITANGIDILAGAVYNPADSSYTANINATHFPSNTSTNPNGTPEQFDTDERVTFQICYEVANCPSGADIPFSYKAWYGCFDEVCQQTGKSSFLKVRPSGSALPDITANLDNGVTICGADAMVSATIQNGNATDTDQFVYTDLHIGFQGCGIDAIEVTEVLINGISVAPVWTVAGDDIDISLETNMDPALGLVDYDGDGAFDDLVGGSGPIDVVVKFNIACGVGGPYGGDNCPVIACENVQFYLAGKTNCGNNFKGFPDTGGFNLQYGQTAVSNPNEIALNTAGTVVGYDFGKYSNDGAPVAGTNSSTQEVEFCYDFGIENINECPSGPDTRFEVTIAGAAIYVNDFAFVPGSAMFSDDGGASYSAVPDGQVSTSVNAMMSEFTLIIDEGNTNTSLCYKYQLTLDDCYCGPVAYIAVTQQVVSTCSDCTPDCDIVKACRNTLFKVDPECSPCPCIATYVTEHNERTNFGYLDKEMTMKATAADIPAVDLTRFMPGDTLEHKGYIELTDGQLLDDPMLWSFNFYLFPLVGSYSTADKLPLSMDAANSILDEMLVENPDGSTHVIDINSLAGCMAEGNPNYNSLNSNFGDTGWEVFTGNDYRQCNATYYDSHDGFDNNYLNANFWNYDRMKELHAANPSIATARNRSSGDCLNEMIAAYDIVQGSRIHFTWRAPLIKNPFREQAKIAGIEPPENGAMRIYPTVSFYQADEIGGDATYGRANLGLACREMQPFFGSCPGELDTQTDIVIDNCGGTIEHTFAVKNFAGPPGDEWFTGEYRPLIELHDIELPIYSPLAYCNSAVVVQNGVETPITVDSTKNMKCSPVAGYADDLCAVDSGSQGSIIFDLYSQGIQGLGIGLDNCDTLRIKYDYCMICPAPVEGLLDYEMAVDWCYTGAKPNDCTILGMRCDNSTAGTMATSRCDELGLAHNVNYYNELMLDTLYCKIDDTGGVVFVDDSAVTPTMSVTGSNVNGQDLIAAAAAGVSVEVKEVEFCNPDPADATGFVGSVSVPNAVSFEGACLDAAGTMPLTSAIVSDDGQIKKYQIDFPSDVLASGDCISVFVKTTLLYCPTPGSLPPEICVATSSGCSPKEVRAAIGGSGACSASEVCYAYLFGEADLQTEWFSPPERPALCETFTMHVRVKNVKDLLLLNLDPNFTLPFGLSLVPGSWEVAYPGGSVDMMGNFGAWTSVPDPDDVNGTSYGWTNEADWSSFIDMNGLVGVTSTLDSNKVAFRFDVTTNCDEFLSGSKARTETMASDPCGPGNLTSGDVESPAIIIDGADPADHAQILAVASPSELFCGGLTNTFGLTALNISENPTTDSVVTCVTIPGDFLTYTPGSIMFTNGFMPAWVTETMIGNDMQVCVHSPSIPAGESWSLTFEAAMNEDAPCGEIEIPADVKSVVEAVSCVPGPPDECAVFVQNSINPVILVDLKPPLETTDVRVSMDCTAGDDPVQVCYEVDLSNPGPAYNGNVRIGIHDDVTANGVLDSYDTELNGMDHAVSLAPGEMTTIMMCLDVDAIQSCPIIIKQTYETDCACDSEETPIMDLSPSFIADLEECVVLCPTQPLELETCGGYDISLDPAAGGVITDDGAGNLEVVLNDGFGVPGTDPVKLVVTGTTGECAIMDMVELKSIGDWVPQDQVADICENDCVDLDLQIPAELEDGATITWTPALGLDDPTIATPEVCDLTADQVYNVEIKFGDACVFNIDYTVTYNPNGVTTITGEEFCLCLEAGTLTGAAGFASYEWYSIQSGAEILEFVGTTNTWNGPTEPGDYFLKAYLGGAICPHVSNVVTLEGKECVDLELEKNIVNIPSPITLGSQITYEIVVCNIATTDSLKFDATNVEISDELPGAVTYVQHTQSSGNYSPTTNQWDITIIESGTCDTLSIDVTIDQTGTIENTAQISGSDQEDIDSTPNNDDGDQSEDDEDDAVIEVVCESLGGEIFYDNDDNGCQDPGESLVMEPVNVSLYECGDKPGVDPPAAVTQVMDGEYEFGVESDDVGADVCLQPDVKYFVVFDIPNAANEVLEDYSFSSMMAAGDCAKDGNGDDVDPNTGASDCYDVSGEDDDNHIDAGITPPCYEIAGEIFYDLNDNGCEDPGESLVDDADIEVSIYECGDTPGVNQPQATTTVSDGMYEFGPDSDDPGADICLENDTEYFVVFDIPNAIGEDLEDYTFSSMEDNGACALAGESDNVDPSNGQSGCVDPDNDDGSDGDEDQNVDAGIVPPCESLGGEIFYDLNDNGCEDSGESLVMETIGVSLFECGDDPATATPVASTVTNDGTYEFGPDSDDPGADVCLEAGTEYFVAFDIPNAAGESLDGYEFSQMTADMACETLGESDDVDPADGTSGCYDPNDDDGTDGNSDNNIDAGIIPPCHSLAGEIFYDGNNNGCQDAMETLVMEAINVTLYECGDTPGVSPPAASTTVTDGMYEFSESSDDPGADICLDAGTEYFVVFDIPNGAGEALEDYDFSSNVASGACATDGNGDDVDPSTGASACYDPDNDDGGDGASDENIDAGITPPCEQIAGEIFYDYNDNGCQDMGDDLVMENINVSLFECGDDPATAAPVASTTVNDGMYVFGETSDDPGAQVCLGTDTEYFVVFDIPNAAGQALEDYQFSSGTASPGCEASGESDDVNPGTGQSGCYNPDNEDGSDGSDDENIDAGIVPPCESLSGEIFYDDNDNGCEDMGESLVDDVNIEVSLYECGDVPGVDQPVASTTVGDGMYEFGEDSDDPGADLCLEAGTEYFVVFDIPNAAGEDLEDYSFSSGVASGSCATSGESDNVDPSTGASGCYDPDDDDNSDGDDDENIDAGITPPCYDLAGEIFYDLNDNGCEDSGETLVMEPINVSVFECGDDPTTATPVASTTVSDGMYEFGPASDDPGADVCLDNDTEYFVVFDIPNAAGEELEDYTFSSGTASAGCEATGESDDVDPATGASGCVNPDDDDAGDGNDDQNVDAGIVPPCESLGGEIFYDGNDDGCQDAMESLVMEAINVTLYECGDTPGIDPPVASTTVSDGMYEFGEDSDDAGADVCLEAGTEYFVVFDIPNGGGEALEDYEFSSMTATGACATDGNGDDVDPTTGQSGCYDPDDSDGGDGDSDNNIDAGITPPCENISGEIFYDNDENGCQDPGESLVMEAINVTLFECGDDPTTATPVASTTVSDGMYEFGETSDDAGADVCLEGGTDYFVVFDFPNTPGAPLEEHEFTTGMADAACEGAGESSDVDPTTGASGCVDPDNDDAGDGDDDNNVDAGITPPCESLGGEIFYDDNANGCQDMGESLVMEAINVTLYECGETPGLDPPVAATTVTDGMYTFGEGTDDPGADICLEAGTQYFVVFDIPNATGEALEDYSFTEGSADPACSTSGESDDVDPSTGESACYDPDNDDGDDGDADNNIDAGITPPCYELAGEIFYDDNGDGCEDPGESLVTGTVMVSLYECGQTPGVDMPAAVTSIVDGMYEFGPESDDPSADVCLENDTQYFVVFDIPNAAGESLEGYMFTMGMGNAGCMATGEANDVDPMTGASGCFDPDNDDASDGADDQNIDAGITPECQSLGGEIFYDYDNSGCEDGMDMLVNMNVNVTLYECGDVPGIDPPTATTTVSDGMYEFGEESADPGADVCLEAGTEYFVVFDIPNGTGEALEGYEFSSMTPAASCVLSGESDDVDPGTGTSGCYDPDDNDGGDGDDDNNIDAGITPPCESLGGEIFYDDNGNGCQDSGEDLVMEIIGVTLYECGDTPGVNPPVASTFTSDGMYEFGEDSDDPGADVCLMPGTQYFVVFDIPNASGESLDGFDFTEGTASAGCEAIGGSDDVDPTTGESGCYDPNDTDSGDGDGDNNIDAGITPPCESIAGEIFYDNNADGCQDGSESLVMEAIDVTLYECGDTPGVDQPTASTTVTDGEYEFGPDSNDPGAVICLDPGTQYFVVFDIPNATGEALENFDFTEGVASGACATSGESDNVDPSTGQSGCVDPDDDDSGDGDDDENVDAGITEMCESMAGEIFYDDNFDGCQDSGESLVMEAINVSLYECGDTPGVDQPVSSTTVSDGEYEFGLDSDDPNADVCLEPGVEYFVVFDIPNGNGEALEGFQFTEGVASGACANSGESDNVDPSNGQSSCHDPSDDDSGDGDDDENIDAGITPPCESLAGEIFYDNNENGCQDGSESLVTESINVMLYECGQTPGVDAPVAMTNVFDGMYEFGMDSNDPGADICLDAGTQYFVVFDIPMGSGEVLDGYEFTDGTASGACMGSGQSDDVDPTTGQSGCFDPNDDDTGDGNSDENIDAGITPPCEQIAGEIFYDDNNNGCQDPGEPLVNDQTIEVVLYQCGDTPGLDQPAAFTSVTDGMYEFGINSDDPGADICLEAGEEYFVEFHIPNAPGEPLEDYYFSENIAAPSCLFSGEGDNIDPNTGQSGCHDPSNTDGGDGDADENIDAGIVHPCEILGGEIFYDDDNDGCHDASESLVTDAVNVTLFECGDDPTTATPVASTTTTDGTYQFGDEYSVDSTDDPCLNPRKEYFVVFDFNDSAGAPLEDHYFSDGEADATCEAAGGSDDVHPDTGESGCYGPDNDDDDMNIDAGITPCEEISGEVFYDWNADGCQNDASEGPVQGVDVYVFECGETNPTPGNALASSTTNADGEYAFGPEESGDAEICLHPDKDYFVMFDIPNAAGEQHEDFYPTDGDGATCAGGDTADDTDPTTGTTGCVDPDGDDDDDDLDMGITPCERIGGEVFYDNDGDGCQDDATEGPVVGVDVYVFECGTTDTSPANALASASTNADGEYAFGPEEAGGANVCLDPTKEYFVVFDIPNAAGESLDDYALTDGGGAVCAGADNSDDVDPATGASGCYDPNGDDDDENIDAGIMPCEELAGEVFYDDNADGCQEDGEEEGVPGVDVYLFECGTTDTSPGNALASTSTNDDGEYKFGSGEDGNADICLDADKEYFVVFDLPNAAGESLAGFEFTDGDGASCTGADNANDVDPLTGQSDCYDPENGDGADGDSDQNIDAGIMRPVDVALVKTTATPGPYTYGQQITFDIEVFNQGSLDLYEVKVNDFIPCGYKYLSLNNGTWSLNPITEVATTTIAGPIAGNSSQVVSITLEIVACTGTPNYTNVAEVESMEDEFGNDVTDDDVDSTGDSDPTNDNTSDNVNNEDGNNGGDEDDNDPETIEIFDLALIKEIITPPMYEPGDTIEFRHTIVNQGTMTAANIQITDHLPLGYTFVPGLNAGWDATTAPAYTYDIPGTVAPGTTEYVSFFATINYVDQTQENYTNIAEISGATDEFGGPVTDADSTPDGDPNNDGDVIDNELNDKGDEDDHDITTIDLLQEFIPPCTVPCDLPCRDQINLSLGVDCEAVVTPAMVLIGLDPACNTTTGLIDITLRDEHGNILPDTLVGIEYLGQNLTYEFTNLDPNCNNTCWGNVLVEYKFLPQIQCPGIDTLPCGAVDILNLPTATAGCLDLAIEVRLVDEVRERLDCDTLFTQKVTRTYRATDELGNSVDCDHTIYVERVDLTSIQFPGNACISCADDGYVFQNNGAPMPWIYGEVLTGSGSGVYGVPVLCSPTANTGLLCPMTGSGSAVPLIPMGGATIVDTTGVQIVGGDATTLCNAAILYTDIEIPSTGCRKKYMRTWEVREWWCSGEFTMGGIQVIEIKDDVAPDIVCPVDFTVSTNDSCAGSVQLPAIEAADNCGGNGIIVSVDYPNGFLYGNGGLAELEVGLNPVRYIVADSCYNDTTCTFNVLVQDLTEPVAICEQSTVISLTTTDYSYVFAESLDDGSWDECGLDRFEVRRMDTPCIAADTLFSDKIAFCCADGGQEVMVVFRAWDKGGNYNDCMVRVEVQDKQVPLLECPANDTIDCRTPYDLANLSATFGGPDLTANCPSNTAVVEELIPDVNQCGIGTIIRVLKVLGDDGVTVQRKCTQLITIENHAPFVASNIQWPLNYDTNAACDLADLDPEDLQAIDSLYGYPIFLAGDDECSLLGYDYRDQLFTSNSGTGECAHIERYWSVIDWCGQDSAGNFARYERPTPQIIKLTNNVSPVLDVQGPVEIVSSNVDCESGRIEYSRTATDDCMNALNWSYIIRDEDGVSVGSGTSNTLIDTLPAGDYIVDWVVGDFCGNFDYDNQILRVTNIKAPSPICLNGVSASLVGEDTDGNGTIDTEIFELWASDIDGGSYHTCDNDIVLSLDQDTSIQVQLFDCDDIGIQQIQLWVTDVETGVQDYCSTFIDIQDEGLCPDANMVDVQGEVYTEELEMVTAVEIELGSTGITDMTDVDGSYAFNNMPMGGTYEIIPKKDIEYLNGVSTLDLIFIQKHILGVELLDSGYKLIAADADSSEDITAIDLIELRKLILGVYDELPANDSWRFVDKDHDFVDDMNPWSFNIPETYAIYNLDSDMSIDFIGVKIGDVNGSVVVNANDTKIDKRNRASLVFEAEETQVKESVYTLEVRSSGYNNIYGWQSTMEFDAENIEIVSIQGRALPVSGDHYNMTNQDQGWITMSYHELEGKSRSLKKDETLFEITYKVKVNKTIAAFEMTSLVTPNEAYNGKYEIMDVDLSYKVDEDVKIVSVSPNPWLDQTTIEFYIPQAGQAKWEFYDVNGRTLYTINTDYDAGYHMMDLERTNIQASGIVYAKLITDTATTEYKMMLIN